jgi:putative phosphoribosyl transferase
MAEIVARELGGDLDVALVRSLPAPGATEAGIGAVAEGGSVHLLDGWRTLASEAYVKAATADALKQLAEQREAYTPRSLRRNPAERLVVFLDDGTSTPSMLAAAILSLRESGARMVVAAGAVASVETAEALRREADVVVILRTLGPFDSAASHFEEFGPKSDSEIRASLKRAWRKPFTRGGG